MNRFLIKLIKKIFHKICTLIEVDLPLKYLGTPYGGWYFSDLKHLLNYLLLSFYKQEH